MVNFFTTESRSLIRNKNKGGPKQFLEEPQKLHWPNLKEMPLITTLYFLLVRKYRNHDSMLPRITSKLSLSKRHSCGTESNPLAKSSNNQCIVLRFSKHRDQSSTASVRSVTVDLLHLKSDCEGLMRWWRSKTQPKWQCIMSSSML